jgi:hypothetical protein
MVGCPRFEFSVTLNECSHYHADYDEEGDYKETCALSCEECKDIPECEYGGDDEDPIYRYE